MSEGAMPEWLSGFLPILILLAVVAVVLTRLPRIEVGHTAAFRRRRVMNWLPLGLTYAFLYMGRYNLTVSKNALGDLMTKADFGTIFGVGTVVYGCSFLINGPLTDRVGGRLTIMISALGAATMNMLLGLVTWGIVTDSWQPPFGLVTTFSILYAGNMYFQSFGAVSIVKVNAAWFHLRESGVFGAIFGVLISLGIYFAFDWGRAIVDYANTMVSPEVTGCAPSQCAAAPIWWVFFAPAGMLTLFFAADFFLVQDSPEKAGLSDFDTADASSGDTEGEQLGVAALALRMLRNPVILTIAAIEFCSGFLRNAIMHWYPILAKETGIRASFVPSNWGLLLCCAGIMGGLFAGVVSDHVFGSRRGPVAAVLYGGFALGSLALFGLLGGAWVGWLVIFMSMCIIGVHGMLSGTASMDFGGKKNVGLAVGIIDGFVYLGTGLQSFLLGRILPTGDLRGNSENWLSWPMAMLPVAVIGLLLATRIWGATARPVKRV